MMVLVRNAQDIEQVHRVGASGCSIEISKLLRRLARDHAGNVAIIVAAAALPVMGIIGLAIDYSYQLSVKTKLEQAADAAAMAGITAAQTYIMNYTGTGDPTASAIASGETVAQAEFNANAGKLPGGGTLTINNLTVARSGSTLTGNLSYTLTMPTSFMAAVGVKTATVSGASTTTVTMATYVNIHVVIDNSESMGIGATANDQQIVYNTTTQYVNSNDAAYACAIACHYSGNGTTDTTALVRSHGATLRIDVAKSAVVAALQALPAGPNYQIAIYTMSGGLKQVQALTSSISTAVAAVNTIDLANDNNDGATDSTHALQMLNANYLTTPGTGLTASTAQGFVMLLTDGVQDSDNKNCTGSGCADSYDSNFTVFSPCNQSNCDYISGFSVPIYIEVFRSDPMRADQDERLYDDDVGRSISGSLVVVAGQQRRIEERLFNDPELSGGNNDDQYGVLRHVQFLRLFGQCAERDHQRGSDHVQRHSRRVAGPHLAINWSATFPDDSI